jgi:hypothetical protein
MNKSILLSIIFCCNLAFAKCPYQSQVEYMWEKIVYARQIEPCGGYLPENVKEFLTSSACQMTRGESLLLAFYPTDCGFDYFVDNTDRFFDVKEFFTLVKELDLKIIFCCPQRHLAEFQSQEEIKKFIADTFCANLNREEVPLRFPTKIILAEIQKN